MDRILRYPAWPALFPAGFGPKLGARLRFDSPYHFPEDALSHGTELFFSALFPNYGDERAAFIYDLPLGVGG